MRKHCRDAVTPLLFRFLATYYFQQCATFAGTLVLSRLVYMATVLLVPGAEWGGAQPLLRARQHFHI